MNDTMMRCFWHKQRGQAKLTPAGSPCSVLLTNTLLQIMPADPSGFTCNSPRVPSHLLLSPPHQHLFWQLLCPPTLGSTKRCSTAGKHKARAETLLWGMVRVLLGCITQLSPLFLLHGAHCEGYWPLRWENVPFHPPLLVCHPLSLHKDTLNWCCWAPKERSAGGLLAIVGISGGMWNGRCCWGHV